jgi:uncharacterized membrane protein (UPF0136 family)
MANKILADLGLSPFSKFLVVFWLSLGLIVLDQIASLTDLISNLSTLSTVAVVFEVIAVVLILYGVYLLHNRQKRGAQIAIAVTVVRVALWAFILAPEEVSLVAGLAYLAVFTVIVAGPVLLFPGEYS